MVKTNRQIFEASWRPSAVAHESAGQRALRTGIEDSKAQTGGSKAAALSPASDLTPRTTSRPAPNLRPRAKRLGVHIPDDYDHFTMMRLREFPDPRKITRAPQPPPKEDCVDLADTILAQYGWGENDNAVFFDAALKTHGATGPDQDACLGSAAFAEELDSEKLHPALVHLTVALAAAHESTHVRQFESLPHVRVTGDRSHLPYGVQARIHEIEMKFGPVLEALAYQGEVLNIDAYRKAVGDALAQLPPFQPNPVRQDVTTTAVEQLGRLRDKALAYRDHYLGRMSPEHQRLFALGKIDEIMRSIIPDALRGEPKPER